ncbi:RNA helicase Mov10l1 [Eurytemora carolleeae]|uniref:RNA helicase Mov10l1 n=1 Tax=Eurytemora carolleeae TaxID=1294199 RepID=UPI000C789554|nr:RNA helicase Mov10l1 [Eurytemora carolleeae]|eukprot:XP_023326960.1 RNA helicase Mov10l1-like [Eurytemora affinis]
MYKIVAFCRWIYYFREDYSIDIEEIRRELGEEFILDIKNYTGKITDVFSSYCIIDSAIYLSFLSIPKSNHLNRSPRVGDYVSLKLQRINENEEYQVLEFEKIWRRSWDDAEPEEEEKEEEGGMSRKEGGLVLSVQGGRMEVLINQEKRSLNLAQIWKENYLPVKGDQLLFSCRVEGDDSDFNGSKIVLAVPQRIKSGDGEVHAMRGKRGKISGDVFLDESVCNYKYAPRNRDNVRFHAVECVPTPATLDCIWRATSVSPKTIHKYFGRSALPPSQEKLDDQAALLSDKNGVEIRGEQSFGTLNFTETAELKLTIRNSNADSIELESIRFPGQVNSKSGTGIPGNQITWSGDSIIAAREVSEIRFKLRPGNIGKHDQLVVFNFKHFNIGRILCANVVSDRLERIFKNSGSSDFTSGTSTIIRVETQDNWVIKGNKRKRDQPPDYISNRLGGYPVPLYLFEKAEESDYSEEVVCIYPTLLIKLNQENYDSKLKALLYIEEVAATLELAQYSLEQVFLVRHGAFLTLTVPGLKERRPSLCLGDSVLLSDIKDPNMPVYEGCIEEVRSTELLLRFDENFQRRYDGELYNVTFKMNRGQYRRQHQCIESADRNLGFNILFPHTVIMKTPQVEFIVENTSSSESSIRSSSQVKGKSSEIKVLSSKARFLQKLNILRKQKQDMPVLVEGEEKQDLPILVEGEKKQDLPFLVEGEEKQDLPLRVEEKVKQDLPVLVEGEEKQDLPVLVEGEEKQYLPVLVEGEKKQYLPVLVEGEEKQDLSVLMEGEEETEINLKEEDKDNKGNEKGKKGDITAKSAEEKEKVEKKDNLSTEETEGEEKVEKKEGFTGEQTEGNKKVVEKKDDITTEDTEGEEKVKKKEDTAVKTEKEEKVGKKEDFKTEESKFEKKEVMSTKATKKVEKVKRTAGEKKKSSTYKKEEKESYEQSKKKGSDHSKIWVIPNVNKIRTEKIDDSFTFIPSLPFQFKYNRVSSSIPAYYPKQGSEPGILKLSWINPSLNPEQRSAVLRILTGEGRPLPYIIYGPPGTGKTVTLVEAVLQLFTMRSDVRILVATPSNSAADLVAERIIRSGKVQVGDLARLNSFQRSQDSIPELLLPYCLKNDEDESLLQSSKHKILVSTCGTVGSIYKLKLKHGHYSHVFVDEAGHMTEPECLVPLGLVHRETGQIVLAGDPQQLGPVIQSPIAALYGLELSLLERLSLLPVYLPDRERFRDHGGYDPLLVTKLVRNYRSHPDILLVPSRLFYENELIPCGAETKINKFINFNFLPSKGHPVIFHGVKGDNRQEPDSPSWFNPQEVWQVAVYTQNLLIEGVEKDDIGIISPYRKQTQKIREMLKVFNIDGIRIGSVEEFQGQEKPVILLTTTRSGTEHQVSDNKQGIGFLASPKRLNVAVTRAQSLLIVIGNPHVLSKDMNWFELLQHIVGLGGYTGCDLPITLQ